MDKTQPPAGLCPCIDSKHVNDQQGGEVNRHAQVSAYVLLFQMEDIPPGYSIFLYFIVNMPSYQITEGIV